MDELKDNMNSFVSCVNCVHWTDAIHNRLGICDLRKVPVFNQSSQRIEDRTIMTVRYDSCSGGKQKTT